ncbi:hypothetical protein QL992_06005 [Microbacterium sp. APC 3898]|nr:hypothetical protein [Microbacterium sp. APC 3898]MDN3498754.1 hypothetical protein [Microbacterium sp. APC 3898]
MIFGSSVQNFGFIPVVGYGKADPFAALQEKELDWINASRTLGSSPIKIIFSQMMPNLVGIIIVNGTLLLAANIGIESGLSFLSFGFPEDYPSLVEHCFLMRPDSDTETQMVGMAAGSIENLCLRNIGEALRRAGDARQRQASYITKGGNSDCCLLIR